MSRWRYIADDGVSGSFGLAADEYLMGGYGEAAQPRPPSLRLYTYRPLCVLVGRFQNVAAEVSDSLRLCFGGDIQRSQMVTQAGMDSFRVELNRRPTGGGTIIMGDGQLGVAFLTSTNYPETPQRPREVLETYAQGVLEGLRRLGIEGARLRSRNDIEVGGRKIAGLGLYSDEQGALLFHTSILVDFDVRLM
ncbi:MAG: biotin/lipoate A/B protein ligase family protein, partial [Dehalococcoidia bacterium]